MILWCKTIYTKPCLCVKWHCLPGRRDQQGGVRGFLSAAAEALLPAHPLHHRPLHLVCPAQQCSQQNSSFSWSARSCLAAHLISGVSSAIHCGQTWDRKSWKVDYIFTAAKETVPLNSNVILVIDSSLVWHFGIPQSSLNPSSGVPYFKTQNHHYHLLPIHRR